MGAWGRAADGGPVLPGSKSHAQRALLLAACRQGTTRLHNVPDSGDLRVMRAAMSQRGARITDDGDAVVVTGVPVEPGEELRIDAGENGTAARLLLTALPLLGCRLRLDGHARLRRRPMAAATALLRRAGVAVDRDTLPIHARGRASRGHGEVWVDADTSTQPASGAMLAAALGGGGVVTAKTPRAGGYLELTAQVLRTFGAEVEATAKGADVRFVIGAIPAGDLVHAVIDDPSARAFPLTLAALHDHDLPRSAEAGDAHPDHDFVTDLARLRDAGDGDLVLAGLDRRPDGVPALAVFAAARSGRTTLAALPTLRMKESDRLAALADALSAVAAGAAVGEDSLVIRGPLATNDGALRVPTTPDHRIVMALALLGTVLPGGVVLEHAGAVQKSWPGYFDWLSRCATVETQA